MAEALKARPAPYDAAQQRRRALLAKVHLAKKELRLDDVAYRALLKRVTGAESAADLSPQQLGSVLDELKAKGFTVRRPKPKAAPAAERAPARRQATSPAATKARALWISLHQLGVVRDSSEAALESFGRRQLGVDRLQWANGSQMYRLIEALKAMGERAGWSQDVSEDAVIASLGGWAVPKIVRDHGGEPTVVALKLRLLERLWFLAAEAGVVKLFANSTVGMPEWLQRRAGIRRFGALYYNSAEELDRGAAVLAQAIAAARTRGTPEEHGRSS